MKLKDYDNKCVKIIDKFNYEYEGNCTYNSKDYNESEFGKRIESLQILNFMFYKEIIKEIIILENGFIDEYGTIEEEIVNDGLDSIIDAFEYEDDEHVCRIIRCIKDNKKLANRDNIIKNIKEYLLKYNKNEKVIEEINDLK